MKRKEKRKKNKQNHKKSIRKQINVINKTNEKLRVLLN